MVCLRTTLRALQTAPPDARGEGVRLLVASLAEGKLAVVVVPPLAEGATRAQSR